MKYDKERYELSKLCVTKKYQGKGAGERLIDKAILKATQLGAEKLVLSTNQILTAAYSLYTKKGFQSMKNPLTLHSNYNRESIYMCLNLNDSSDRENKRK